MHLNRQIRIQLAIFTAISAVALALMTLHYMKLPAKLFGVSRYTVSLELPRAGGLYESSNVTFRGSEVGSVTALRLTDTGVVAELSLRSGTNIPSDLKAEVHSQSAVGEQYVELRPRNATSRPLRAGDVIPAENTSVPTDINSVLDSVRAGLQAIPHDNLKTVIDESFIAVGGLGPQLSKIVDGSINLSTDARRDLDSMLALIENASPVLDSQSNSSNAIQNWASQLAAVTQELHTHDAAVAGVIDKGAPALSQARQLVGRLQPALPTLLANLVSVGQVALAYHDDLEQILVLAPQLIAVEQGSFVANVNTKQDYRGAYLSFNLNLNLPPPCTTGYLPAQQMRNPVLENYPDRPAGDLYCRVPQDSPNGVRGARNIPCETRPGKRAPTVEVCESDETYVPLNDGDNWKGDPNATYSGQGIPQLPPGSPPRSAQYPIPPVPGVQFNPDTGGASGDKTWQQMLLPPGS